MSAGRLRHGEVLLIPTRSGALWALTALLLSSCASPAKALCKADEACSGNDATQCLEYADEYEADAAAAGCTREFDNQQNCVKVNTTCTSGALRLEPLDACFEETADFLDCLAGDVF